MSTLLCVLMTLAASSGGTPVGLQPCAAYGPCAASGPSRSLPSPTAHPAAPAFGRQMFKGNATALLCDGGARRHASPPPHSTFPAVVPPQCWPPPDCCATASSTPSTRTRSSYSTLMHVQVTLSCQQEHLRGKGGVGERLTVRALNSEARFKRAAPCMRT